MYLTHFGLSETPFNITPDPRYLFMSDRHREAMAHLTFGVTQGGGFVQLTGEVGTGKTTICRCLLGQVPDDVEVALITDPKISEHELLAAVCDELRIPYPARSSSKNLVDRLNERLLDSHARGRRTVLIIDEAQNLNREVLERVRLLTNLETARQKLLQIILIGQPELTETLARPDLRQLAQRITARYHLAPLKRRDVADYVTHRLSVAGCHRPLFTRTAIRELFKETGGVPRLVNVVCDRALLGAYARGRHHVDGGMIKKASDELRSRRIGTPKRWSSSRFPRLSTSLAALALMGAGGLAVWFATSPTINEGAREPVSSRISEWRSRLAAFVEPDTAASSAESGILLDNSQASTVVANAENAPAAVQPAAVQTVVQPAAVAPRATPTTAAPTVAAAASESSAVASTAPIAAPVADEKAVTEVVEHEPPSLGPPLDEVLDANESATSLEAAFKRLVMVWGEPFDAGEESVCERAQRIGLKCLNAKGDWENLRRFDRPALLGLASADSSANEERRQYVVLNRLTASTARLVVNDQEFVYSRDDLEELWTGDYVILWRPPTSSTFLSRGTSGDDVAWLRQAIDQVFPDQLAGELGDGALFDEQLEKLIIQFQEGNALSERGSVGAETLIALNSKLESGMPRLDGSSGGRRL